MVKGYVDDLTHTPTKEYLVDAGGEYHEAAAKLFGSELTTISADQMIREFDECGVEKMIVVGWDAETQSGLPRVPNEFVAKYIEGYPDRMVGFASVDPNKGKVAVADLEHAVRDLGLRGLKLHPMAQGFYPSDKRFYPLWEKCVELKIPVQFHTGTSGWGKLLPGGGGAKLDYSNPIYLDSVAADFPELQIVMLHQAFPWVKVQLAVAAHKRNVYVDLSGYSPKYFEPELITYMTKLIPDKFMFGSDYPFLKPGRWLKDFELLKVSDEVKMKVLRDNAVRFYRL